MKSKILVKILIQVLLPSIILANSSNIKLTVTDIKNVKDKTSSKVVENNKNEIFEKMGSCTASCCSSGDRMTDQKTTKVKSPRVKKKSKFRWFSNK